jgi:hypothetical protein
MKRIDSTRVTLEHQRRRVNVSLVVKISHQVQPFPVKQNKQKPAIVTNCNEETRLMSAAMIKYRVKVQNSNRIQGCMQDWQLKSVLLNNLL